MALCCGWPKAKGSIKSKVLENDYNETKVDGDAANPFSYKGRPWNKEKEFSIILKKKKIYFVKMFRRI